MLGKIAGLLLLKKTMSASSSLLENLFAGLVVVAVLSLMATLLLGSLILGGVIFGYQALLTSGYEAQTAALIMGGAVLCLLVIILAAIVLCIRKLRKIPKRLVINEAPALNIVSNITDAFVEGFRRPQARR